MARTVNEGFVEFLRRLSPSDVESEAAKKHRASIEQCLKTYLEIISFFRTGSFGYGTSIIGASDVDYFAWIPIKNVRDNSATMLNVVRDILNQRFPGTDVQVRTPAVRIMFAGGSEATEIVPASYAGDQAGESVYNIPTYAGKWQKSSPTTHIKYVNEVNKNSGGKTKPLVRFIKAWKYLRGVPISSFFLEMYVARYCSGVETFIYSWDVTYILSRLLKSGLSSMQDPTGTAGYIYPCFTDAQKADALSKLQTAETRAQKALSCEKSDDIDGAFTWWNLLYDDHFPSR